MEVRYEPSEVGSIRQTLTATSAAGGTYSCVLHGTCEVPKPQGPIVRGLLESVGEMRQGGRRLVVVPPSMAFGADGAALAGNVVVPPNATVQYDIELTRVSVPPS